MVGSPMKSGREFQTVRLATDIATVVTTISTFIISIILPSIYQPKV